MKKFILSLAVIATGLVASAQSEGGNSGFKFSLGLEGHMPIGDFSDAAGFGIGGTVQGNYWIDNQLALTLQAGYIRHSGKDIEVPTFGFDPVTFLPTFGTTTVEGPSYGIIPVLAGIQYNFGTSGVYGSAQLGTGIFTSSGGGSSTSTFAYAPGIGYRFSDKIDALLKYQAYSKNNVTNSVVGLRLAYTF